MRNKLNKGTSKLIQLWIPKEKWALLEAASASVDEPITTFCRRAIYGTLRNWKSPGGEVEGAAGKICTQCQGRPASKCSNPTQHKNSDMWTEA